MCYKKADAVKYMQPYNYRKVLYVKTVLHDNLFCIDTVYKVV